MEHEKYHKKFLGYTNEQKTYSDIAIIDSKGNFVGLERRPNFK